MSTTCNYQPLLNTRAETYGLVCTRHRFYWPCLHDGHPPTSGPTVPTGRTPAPISAEIARYVAAHDQERADGVAAALAALTDRERALVREAAVMGFVRGTYCSEGAIPSDRAIVQDAAASCQGIPEFYPLLGGAPADTAELDRAEGSE